MVTATGACCVLVWLRRAHATRTTRISDYDVALSLSASLIDGFYEVIRLRFDPRHGYSGWIPVR